MATSITLLRVRAFREILFAGLLLNDLWNDLILDLDIADFISILFFKYFEPPRGVEPPTHALRMRCSTN